MVIVFLYSKFAAGGNKITYQTTPVERGTIVSSITGSGQIASTTYSTITSLASGRVLKSFVKDGDQVKSGQILATLVLDQAGNLAYLSAYNSYQAAINSLSSARNSLNSLQSSLFAANQKFINDAVQRNLSTDDPTYIQQHADWKAAEGNYLRQMEVIKQSESAVSQAALSLRQYSSTIIAPTDGKIYGFSLQAGDIFVGGSSVKLASIYTGSNPSLKLNLTEIDVLRVKIGQKVNIALDALPDQSFTGKVVSIDKSGVQSSGVSQYPVVVFFDLASADVLPNMSATGNIILNLRTDALSVPTSAITTSGNQSTVRLLVNGQPKDTPVTLGLVADTNTEILSGLNEGDLVVTGQSPTSNASTQTTSIFSSLGRAGGGAQFRAR